MAIRVGQVRKNSGQEYITQIDHTLTTYKNSGVGTEFEDFAIQANFEANVTYYIRVLVNRIEINKNMGDVSEAGDNDPHNQNIDIRLYQSLFGSDYQTINEPILVQPYYDESSTSVQNEDAYMKWCADSIAEGHPPMSDYAGADEFYRIMKENYDARRSSDDGRQTGIRVPTQTIELVFTPYKNSQFLVFQLRRVAYDYTIEPRIVNIDAAVAARDVARVNNILPRSVANKIGIQTRPGELVAVNKEPMRVGKSGTLEINNGIPITSVSMIAPLNDVDDFILDYTYTT